ncbi:MAG: LacI family DNA-binding transcriptional regulator [Armatimonadota bacterium]
MTKPPTINDVAGALGMHTSTVSLALSGKGTISARTRERVITVARDMGYQPNALAQRLARGRDHQMVGMVSSGLDVGLATEKILRIQKALTERAIEAPIYNCGEPKGDNDQAQAEQIRHLCRLRPHAVICTTSQLDTAAFEELEFYQRAGGIVVSYDDPVPLACDQVIFDRADNGYKGAQHLLSEGHRKIGIGITSTAEWLPGAVNRTQTRRLAGWRAALESFGVSVREDWIFHTSAYEQGGAEMARRFLSLEDRPTGMCIINDYSAMAFMVELLRAGLRIPGDISIVSHDNQPVAAFCGVPLTSVTHPVKEIVDTVIEQLISRLEGRYNGEPRTVVLRGELEPRASTAPAV